MNRMRFVRWASSFLLASIVFLPQSPRSALFAQATPEAPAATSDNVATDQAPAASAELETELTQFRDGLFKSFNEGKYQEMLDKYCHPEVIATWQDGTTSRGHQGVLAEFDKLKQFIRQMQVHPNTDQRLVLDGGRIVVSSGEMQDDYQLSRGPNVQLHSRWSATLVKTEDRWQLVSFSASTNAFENEVIDLYLQAAKYQWGAIAGIVGLVVGAIIMKLAAGRKR